MTQETKPDPKRNKSQREIEAELGETRAALTEDVRALTEKVSPAHLKQEAKHAVQEAKDTAMNKASELKNTAIEKAVEVKDAAVEKATEIKDMTRDQAKHAAEVVSDTVDEVGTQARRAGRAAWSFGVDNAVPLGLIGLGAGWIIANQRRNAPQTTERNYEREYRAGLTTTRTTPARNALREPRFEQVRRASRDFAQENPLALALGTLVAGIGVGLLLPATTRETQLFAAGHEKLRNALGEARDTARNVGTLAKQTARDTIAAVEGTTTH